MMQQLGDLQLLKIQLMMPRAPHGVDGEKKIYV